MPEILRVRFDEQGFLRIHPVTLFAGLALSIWFSKRFK